MRIPMRALGFQANNPHALHDSASRAVMFGSHYSQSIVFAHPTEKIVQSGMEVMMGMSTFKVKMPADGTILAVVQRFHKDGTDLRVDESPDRIVIYEDRETRTVDYFSIPSHCSNHQTFGFKYKFTDLMNKLRPDVKISKDEVFADSPNIGPRGEYNNGRTMNVVFTTSSAVAEDAIEIRKGVLPNLAFTMVERRSFNVGSSCFLLNLFGSKSRYQGLPNVGDYIREDGLLAKLRKYDTPMAPAIMSVEDVMEPDHYFDEGVYVRAGKGKIIDIQVVKSNTQNRVLPETMSEQLDQYANSYRNFHKQILDEVRKIKRERKHLMDGEMLKLSPRMRRLVVESMAIADSNAMGLKQPLILTNRREPNDEYHVTVTIEYTQVPTMGGKLSDSHGKQSCRF